MDSLRISSLFHYTDFNSLKRILAEGLVPNYCSEDLTVRGRKFVIGLPMVCFCDIPLTRTDEFTKRYGRSGSGQWVRGRFSDPLYSLMDFAVVCLEISNIMCNFGIK